MRRRNHILCLGLAGLVLLVYGRVALYPFFGVDDYAYVQGNPVVAEGLTGKGLRWAFTSFGYEGNWHPLTWLSHMLDVEVFKLWAGGHHLTNVALHLGTTLVLFLVLARLTSSPLRSALVAALFAVHPQHVESVAWIAERKDVLSALFWMLALGAYGAYARSKRASHYGLVLLFFVLGFLSKPMVVTLPFVLLLLDLWPLGRFGPAGRPDAVLASRLLAEKLPLLLLAALFSAVTYLAQVRGGAVASTQVLPISARVGNAAFTYWAYVWRTVWPWELAVFYPPHPQPPVGTVVLALSLLAAVSGLAGLQLRKRPYLTVGWFWYVGTLVPVIGLVQVGSQGSADRYTYLPLVGLFVAAVWGVGDALKLRGKMRSGAALAALVLAASAALAYRQVGYWQNTESLFRRTLAVTKDNWNAHDGLAGALLESGRIPEAIEHYRQALRIAPYFADGHAGLGEAYGRSGDLARAAEHLEIAERLNPADPDTYVKLGQILRKAGRHAEALAQFTAAARLAPDDPVPHQLAGLVLQNLGRLEEAVACYREALRVNPRFWPASNNLGNTLMSLGRLAEATQTLEAAHRLAPERASASMNLGIALAMQGQTDRALPYLEAAVRADPNSYDARYNLGLALEVLGRSGEAGESFRQALRLRPDAAEPRSHLTALEAGMGR